MTYIDHIESFKSLFKGREDIYAIRWEKDNKSGYMPAYKVDWNDYKIHKSKGGSYRITQKRSINHLLMKY